MGKIVRSGQIRKCSICKKEFATTEKYKMCCGAVCKDIADANHKRAMREKALARLANQETGVC